MNTSAGEEREALNRLIADTAMRTEVHITYTRMTIMGFMLTRYFMLDPSFYSLLIILPTALVVFVYSMLFLLAGNRFPISTWLRLSVALDAVVCFILLLDDVINSDVSYRGITTYPDTALILVICFANGLRLSTAIALGGGVLNLLLFLTLLFIDEWLNSGLSEFVSKHASMWVLMIISATLVSVITAYRTRNLVTLGARESIRLERLRHGVQSVLHGHHDAHSLISSAFINADRLLKVISPKNNKAFTLANYLKEDVNTLANCINQVKHSSADCLSTTMHCERVLLNEVVREITHHLKTTLNGVEIELQLPTKALPVSVAGGVYSIKRIMMNLLQNAKEGNGSRGANKVRIILTEYQNQVELRVEDNGPGFEDLNELGGTGSNKLTGLNVGLKSTESIIAASRGLMELGCSELGGAAVKVVFSPA